MTEQVQALQGKATPLWELQSPLLRIAKGFLQGAIGFVLAGYTPGGGIYPFGIAFVGTLSGNLLFPVSAAVALGYWVQGGVSNLSYIGGVMLCAMMRWLLFGEHTGKRWASGAVAAVALAIPSFALSLLGGANLYRLMLSAIETALCFTGSYFFYAAQNYLREGQAPLTKQDSISCVMFLCILVAALERWHFLGLPLGLMAGCVLILTAAQQKGEARGALLGTALASASMLMQAEGGGVSPLFYAVGGMLAGVFRPVGRIPSALAVVGVGMLFVSASSPSDPLFSLLAVGMGAVIYLIFPERLYLWLFPLPPQEILPEEETLCALLKTRLENCGQALRGMKETTREVSFVTDRSDAHSLEGIYEGVAEKVCKYCPQNGVCWQENYGGTLEIFRKQIALLQKNQTGAYPQFPSYFKERCPQTRAVGEGLQAEYREYLRTLRSKREIARLRWVVTEQLEGVSQLLQGIADTVETVHPLETYILQRLWRYFASRKIQPTHLFCYRDRQGRVQLEVEVATIKAERLQEAEVTEDLSEILETPLDLPAVTQKERQRVLRYSQSADYTVEYAVSQLSAGGNPLCGDSCRMVRQANSKVFVVLSDGMGTGKHAAIESAMTTNMLCELLSGGADYATALRLVNSALLCKSTQECFATADIASVDLYTGAATFYKAAAAPTFVVKGGRVGRVTTCSLPIGMLEEISMECSKTLLEQGDCIVQVSDGVTASGEQWVIQELERMATASVEEIAHTLSQRARERTLDSHEDDITVSVLRLR